LNCDQERFSTLFRINFLEINSKENIAQAVNFNPLTPELNPSPQRYLTRFFTGDFAS
jgi:transcription termination factor Rho